MTFHCEVCGNLLDSGYPCDRCHHDPEFDKKDQLRPDGGPPELSYREHLEAALEMADHQMQQYHIRAALQYEALVRGEVGVDGTYSPDNGGVVD